MKTITSNRKIRPLTAAVLLTTLNLPVLAATGPGEDPDLADTVWLTYHNDYAGQRYSPLSQIDTTNVSQLKEVCRLVLSEGGSLQSGPILIDGTLYVTTALDTFAVDPTDCTLKWKSSYQPVAHMPFPVNRGVAYLNGRLFRGTPDGHLIALDARTGEKIWDNVIADTSYGEFTSAAPIAWNGMVFMGIAGGDWGIRGRIMAYDALTGRELWRFNTIPRGDEVGAETWEDPESARIGGGGTWSSYTLDIREGELFVSVGNPAQDMLPDLRPGDNLFTNSLVVLDARTGALKWWYQAVKNDPWDYDIGAPAMLYQLKRNNIISEIAAIAGKDGYLHAVDRDTRERLFKTAVTTQYKEAPMPTEEGAKACPGFIGGTQWNGPAYAVDSHLILVGAVDWCTIHKRTGFDYERGQLRFGGTMIPVNDPPPSGWITAIDADTGEVKWKYQTEAPVVAAVTPTAGGVAFTGDTAGNLLALETDTGKVLMSKKLDGALGGGIITYAAKGRQFVAAVTGNVSRVTFGGPGQPSIVVWGL